MAKKDQSIAGRLARAHLAITNALDDTFIMNAVARFNYDEPRVRGGLRLYERAGRLSSEQSIKRGEKLAANVLFRQSLQEAKAGYMLHLKIARLTLKKDPAVIQMLGLEGVRKRTIAGWLEEAGQFYINALSEPKIVEDMSGYGIAKKDLEEGQKRLETIEQASADLEKKKGLAKQAKKDRDQALLELEEWLRIFLQICRYALAERPQLLEKFGIVVRSSPRPGLKNGTGK